MTKRELGNILFKAFPILTVIPTASGATITVNPTGRNDQNNINNAINMVTSGATPDNPGHVVLVAGTYNISAPIVLKSNVVLEGAGDSTIIYAINSSVGNSEAQPGYIYRNSVSYVEINGLQFKSTASGPRDGGHGDYRNCIILRSSSNCNIHDILFSPYLYGDGVRISSSSYINVYNCRIWAGHDGVSFLSSSHHCRMYNCSITVQTNSGCRNDDSSNCEVDHNTITGDLGSGWCCLQVQDECVNLNIHHNILHDFHGSSKSAGIGSVNASGSINIHDNVMWNVSPYSEIPLGTGNILGPSDRNVANWVARGYGYGSI
jgi:polygalacturonase